MKNTLGLEANGTECESRRKHQLYDAGIFIWRVLSRTKCMSLSPLIATIHLIIMLVPHWQHWGNPQLCQKWLLYCSPIHQWEESIGMNVLFVRKNYIFWYHTFGQPTERQTILSFKKKQMYHLWLISIITIFLFIQRLFSTLKWAYYFVK